MKSFFVLTVIILAVPGIGRADVNTQAISLSDWEGAVHAPGIVYNGMPAIKWNEAKSPSASTIDIPHDWREFSGIEFALHSAKATGSNFMLVIASDEPKSEGMDHYGMQITIDWTGWREFAIPLNELPATRLPTWGNVDKIAFTAEGWGNHPDPEAVIHISGLRLTTITGPGISDAELFGILNLDYPGLEKVQAAVSSGNFKLAKQELADYYCDREKPVWKFDWRARPKHDTRPEGVNTQDADRFLKHEMNSVNHWHQFGEQIDWNLNPIDYREWPWGLNRHFAWVSLGRAYWDTGEEEYAREFVSQMMDWVTRCPVPRYTWGNSSYTWRTIETGIRAGQTLPEAYYRFLSSPSFTDDAIIMMVKSFVEHARHLMKWPTSGNWLAMESNGLMTVGVLFPEFEESAEWRKTATDRIYAEMDKQVYPDGAQIELSTGYHHVSLDNFLMAYHIAKLNDVAMPADYLSKLENMWEHSFSISMPDGTLPGLNDADRLDVRRTLGLAFSYFPNRKDFQWVATSGKEGEKPQLGSVALPFAGRLVMRSGWDPNDLYMLLDAGPHGYGHQHEDALSVVLYAHRKYLVIDPGSYHYDRSQWRRYVISTRAHNTIMVDGLEQHRGGRPREQYVLSKPLPNKWASSKEFDYAVGTYSDGYGSANAVKVTHTRHIFFVKPEYWIIVDSLNPSDEKPHRYESMFHVDCEGLSVDDRTGRTDTTDQDGPGLTILPLGLAAKVISGQEKPVVQGWMRTSGYDVRPLPTAIFAKEASGPAVMAYVVYPTAEGANCPITSIEQSGTEIAVHFSDGRVDSFRLADYQAAYTRTEGGKVAKSVTIGGKSHGGGVLELKDLSKTELTHHF